MATYSTQQAEALHQAKQLLKDASLTASDLNNNDFSSSSPPLRTDECNEINFASGTMKVLSHEELEKGEGRITRKVASSVNAIVEHSLNAIVEYPESGSLNGLAVAHLFPIDPEDWVHPKDNFQYSLGDQHGQDDNIRCRLLDRYSTTNTPVLCTKLRMRCRSMKHCAFTNANSPNTTHPTATISDANREVFTKTLGFFGALIERGCRFGVSPNGELDGDEEDCASNFEGDKEEEEELVWLLTNSRAPAPNDNSTRKCGGKFILEFEKDNRASIRCEHYKPGRRGHLVLRNLEEFNLNYLKHLMHNDLPRIWTHELEALSNGYGPLVPCGMTCACRDQKELCSTWHRDMNGKLQRGKLVKMNDCPTQFEIYQPNNLRQCPYILVVSRNPHSHPNPPRTYTPASIRIKFNELLYRLDWRLTNATPRRLLLDNGFMSDLRRILNWRGIHDPTLADLHPSFANHDHTGRLINTLRLELYPNGTGLAGAKYLVEEHPEKNIYKEYVRYIKEHKIPGEKTIHIVICMFPAMSNLFHQTKRPSIDTSFKRLYNWQEFEIEAWFPQFARSVVLARAFTTSQSAEAHQILFRELFKIVAEDTGSTVHFRHIHGDGFETITADGHRGQALGLGLYFEEICKGVEKISLEWNKPLRLMTPTEHLACIYRYCLAHFFRNITSLQNSVSSKVRAAMISLSSAEPLPDYEKVLKCIRNGGEKAAKWLKDKQASNGVMLAGIYRPASKIPIEIWKAAPTTSNGNEQAHRNINRDGTGLTMLAGIMRGLQYDSRAMQGCLVFEQEGIYLRDQDPTSFRRSIKAIGKKERVQRKIIEIKDSQIAQVNQTIIKLQRTVQTNAHGAKRALESKSPEKIETAVKRLRNANNTLQKNRDKLGQLILQGSGRVKPSGILPAEELFNPQLLDMPAEPEPTKTEFPPNPPSPSTVSPLHSPCPPPVIHPPTVASNLPQPLPQNSQTRPSYISSQPSEHPNHPNLPKKHSQPRPSNPYPLPPLTRPSQPPPYHLHFPATPYATQNSSQSSYFSGN